MAVHPLLKLMDMDASRTHSLLTNATHHPFYGQKPQIGDDYFLRGGTMEVKATLAPGQNGTKLLLKEYGDQLVCVRYRYDKARQKRLKTVELIIDERDWIPGVTIPTDKLVGVKIGFGETELRERVKKSGGYWNPEKKSWMLSFHKVLQMGLERRMVDGKLGF